LIDGRGSPEFKERPMKKIFTLVLICLLPAPALAEDTDTATAADSKQLHVSMHKSPYCGCCALWAEHLREHGFVVAEVPHDDMIAVKEKFEIPQRLQSCHTAEIDGYVIEGHVPARDILEFLKKPPQDARGLAVPGMPLGSPGMEHPRPQSYQTLLILNDGNVDVFAEHPADDNQKDIPDHSHGQ
jgi:hypothetical protein